MKSANPLICPKCAGQVTDDILQNLYICEECNWAISAELVEQGGVN